MNSDSSEAPVATVFANGRCFLLGKSRKNDMSYFGGPGCDSVIAAPRFGPRPLHHILTLNHAEFGIKTLRFGFKVSFYYGICFEGCELEWQRTALFALKITKMQPRKSGKEQPYFGYPDVLPWFPLEIINHSEAATPDIEDAIYNTGWEADPSKVYVIAHSHPELGIALFTPGMDVDIVFEYEPESGKVRAANQCG